MTQILELLNLLLTHKQQDSNHYKNKKVIFLTLRLKIYIGDFIPMELKAKNAENERKKLLKNKNKHPFNKSDARFNSKAKQYKHQNKLGPGEYYDPSQTTWSKRTYNILFAEI